MVFNSINAACRSCHVQRLLFAAFVLAVLSSGARATDVVPPINENNPDLKEHRFRKLPCGLNVASNRAFSHTWQAMSDLLEAWMDVQFSRKTALESKVRTDALSYVDGHRGNRLVSDYERDLPASIERVWQVIPANVTDFAEDKLTFAIAARKAGLEGDVVPRTFETREQAQDALDLNEAGIFFVKDRFGTKGRGITVHTIDQLATIEVPKYHVIQEAVAKDLALHNGRKVTARLFLAILNGCLYIHHSGWIKSQEAMFESKTPDHSTHVSHQYKAVYNIDLHYPPMEIAFHKPLLHRMQDEHNWGSQFDMDVVNGTKWMESYKDLSRKLAPSLLHPIIEHSAKHENTFTFLGVDVVPLKDGKLKLLEINTFPSFFRFDIFADVILTMLGLEYLDPELAEKRLIKVWDINYGKDDNKWESGTEEF